MMVERTVCAHPFAARPRMAYKPGALRSLDVCLDSRGLFIDVIRVDPTRPPAHQCAWRRLPNRIPYSPRPRAQRESKPRRFSGPRKPGADGQCRRGARTAAESRWPCDRS
jgi:hypothetical protein